MPQLHAVMPLFNGALLYPGGGKWRVGTRQRTCPYPLRLYPLRLSFPVRLAYCSPSRKMRRPMGTAATPDNSSGHR